MINRLLQSFLTGAPGNVPGCDEEDFAARLREAGVPIARLASVRVTANSLRALAVQALVDELLQHGYEAGLARVIRNGENRLAFDGVLELMKKGLLSRASINGAQCLDGLHCFHWLDDLVFCGREPVMERADTIDLTERFCALSKLENSSVDALERLQDALFSAIRANRTDKVLPLMAAGAHPDRPARFHSTPLCFAVQTARLNMLPLLHAAGADPNLAGPDGMTPLALAVTKGLADFVVPLVHLGANVNGRCLGDMRPLHLAAAQGDVDMVSALLRAKADVGTRRRGGESPLHTAAQCGQVDVVVALLHAGADARVCNTQGESPLHIAAGFGFLGIAQVLVSLAPEAVGAQTKSGQTAFALAQAGGHGHLAKIILAGMAGPANANGISRGARQGPLCEIGDSLDPCLQF